jgi:hypothetical protein
MQGKGQQLTSCLLCFLYRLREDGTPGSQTPGGGSQGPSPRHRRSDSGTLAPSSPLAALQGLLNLRTISFDAVLAAQRKLNITSTAATSEDACSAPVQVRSSSACHAPACSLTVTQSHTLPAVIPPPLQSALPDPSAPFPATALTALLSCVLQVSPRRSLSSMPLRAAHTSNSSNSPQRRPSPPHQPPPAFQLAHTRGASLDVLREESRSTSGRCSSEGQSSLSISLGSAVPTARIASLQASGAGLLPDAGSPGKAPFPAGPLAEALEAHLAECASQQGSTPLVLLQQDESLQHAGSGGSISFGHGHSHRTLSLTIDRAMSDTSEASVHQPTPPAAEAAKQPIQMHFEAAQQQQALRASIHREQAAAMGAVRDSTSLSGAEEECCSEAASSSGSSCLGGARKLQLLPQPAPGDVDVGTTLALDQACDSSQQLLGSPKSSLSGKSSPSVSPTKAGSQAGSALLHKQAPELYYSAQNLAVQAALSQGSRDSGLAQLKSRFQAVQQQQSPSQQSSSANPAAVDSADDELLQPAGIIPLRVRVLASAGARGTITEGSPHRYGSAAISNSGSNTVDDGGDSPSNTPTSKLQQHPEEPEVDAVTPKARPSTALSSPAHPAGAGSSKVTPAASPSSAPLPKVSIDFATTGIPQRQMALAALAGNLKVDIVPQITRRLSNRVRDTGSESPSAAAAAAAPASPEVAAAPAVQVPKLQKVASMRAAFEKGM